MAFNPMALMKLKGMWESFNAAHPKLLPYFKAVAGGYIAEGTVAEITFTDPEGKSLKCNVKLSSEDLDMFRELANMGKNM